MWSETIYVSFISLSKAVFPEVCSIFAGENKKGVFDRPGVTQCHRDVSCRLHAVHTTAEVTDSSPPEQEGQGDDVCIRKNKWVIISQGVEK